MTDDRDGRVEDGVEDEAELDRSDGETGLPGAADDPKARSEQACPACGAHRLTILDFPDVPALGYQAYSELLGMGELHASTPPAIGCLECGAEWHDLAAFRAAQESAER